MAESAGPGKPPFVDRVAPLLTDGTVVWLAWKYVLLSLIARIQNHSGARWTLQLGARTGWAGWGRLATPWT